MCCLRKSNSNPLEELGFPSAKFTCHCGELKAADSHILDISSQVNYHFLHSLNLEIQTRIEGNSLSLGKSLFLSHWLGLIIQGQRFWQMMSLLEIDRFLQHLSLLGKTKRNQTSLKDQ